MADVKSKSIENSGLASEGQGGPASHKKSARQVTTENRVAEISSLLRALEDAANESGLVSQSEAAPLSKNIQHENRLVQVRLGIASSLFTALRHKHPQSAAHCLRVALGCSSWALFAGLDAEITDAVELAALMHDVGKIGVADSILLKSSRLTPEEKAIVGKQWKIGLEILSSCCGSERVLDAVRYARARYDGQGNNLPNVGDNIPLEARMITIVDAFDSMTTDHVYRRASSRERAFSELFEGAGKQFDPVLVKQFVEMISKHQEVLSGQVASRWLGEISRQSSELPWQEAVVDESPEDAKTSASPSSQPRSLFEQKLIDAMRDGVVFVDSQAKVCLWSKGAERLTGVSSGAVMGRVFAPSLLDMCNHANRRLADEACPVAKALLTNTQLRQRLLVMGRQGKHVAIDLHAIPVQSRDGTVQGVTVLLHDAQPEASLEEKCEALYAEVTKDPMTKVANRAEFDRMHALFIEAHKQAKQPCSLIMVDIDHFKNINDTYGHQAGDEAIKSMANLLSSMCRSGDLVARYGGEEFAVLCADCSNADAARRAEQIRKKLSETQHSFLGNKRITASFGVTELQSGDTSESMLRRSDRALLMAKENGRNQVIQLGDGMDREQSRKKWWQFGRLTVRPVVQSTLTTMVPIDIAIEKLRGFVSDHKAKIISTNENSVELEVSSESVSYDRRKGDRHIAFRVKLRFHEDRIERSNNIGYATGEYAQTRVELSIRPKSTRKGRKSDRAERARLILQSIKAYLMAKEGDATEAPLTAVAEG
ncbi:MAG: diguanylate cyclase [Planctomycetales bacterium]|nr:diguanylate cyclase [Planctomycetales bacterium]